MSYADYPLRYSVRPSTIFQPKVFPAICEMLSNTDATPTALGMQPRRADLSGPAWVKRKIVVDEKECVGTGFVAEVSGHREGGEGDTETRRGRLVYLAKDHDGLVNNVAQ
jgi:hypothetical protein